MRHLHQHQADQHQAGWSLLETLIGLLLLSISVLAASHLHTSLWQHGRHAQQRTQAVYLAQQTIELLRQQAWQQGLIAIHSTQQVSTYTTLYTVYSERKPSDSDHLTTLMQVNIQVQWLDTEGQAQQFQLSTQIDHLAPLYSAVLSLPGASHSPVGQPLAWP
jgi:Tfp pilus assembly protein PilV